MEASSKTIVALFSGPRRYHIPLYQRHYQWQEEHCNALWEDFIRIHSSVDSCHYLGTMVVEATKVDGNKDDLQIVDGQQRTTSLMLLLKELNESLDESLDESLTDLIRVGAGPEGLRLVPQQGHNPAGSDRSRFSAAMASSEVGYGEENQFTKNAGFFRARIQEYRDLAASDRPALTHGSVLKALERMLVSYVELKRKGSETQPEEKWDDPQIIFEKMNSEGKDLATHDLIRNFVFMLAAESDTSGKDVSTSEFQQNDRRQRSIYLNGWRHFEAEFPERAFHQMKHFFRDYLIIKTGNHDIRAGADLYQKFKEYLRDGSGSYQFEGHSLKSFTIVENLVNDLWRHADAWGKVVFANPIKYRDNDGNLATEIREFSRIANADYYPFATMLLLLEDVELAGIFSLLNKFRVISDLTGQTVRFNRDFASKFTGSSPSEDLKQLVSDLPEFRRRLTALWKEGFDQAAEIRRALTGSPDVPPDNDQPDQQILGAASQTEDPIESPSAGPAIGQAEANRDLGILEPVYQTRSRILTSLLVKVNEEMMRQTGDTLMTFDGYDHSLEHIMPQTPGDEWKKSLPHWETYLHTLGNLTLLGSGYNSQVSNKPPMQKFEYYKNSNYVMTRRVVGELDPENLEKGLQKRANLLAELAVKTLAFN